MANWKKCKNSVQERWKLEYKGIKYYITKLDIGGNLELTYVDDDEGCTVTEALPTPHMDVAKLKVCKLYNIPCRIYGKDEYQLAHGWETNEADLCRLTKMVDGIEYHLIFDIHLPAMILVWEGDTTCHVHDYEFEDAAFSEYEDFKVKAIEWAESVIKKKGNRERG